MLIGDRDGCGDDLIEAILMHVSLEGWSYKALKLGASDINLSSDVQGADERWVPFDGRC